MKNFMLILFGLISISLNSWAENSPLVLKSSDKKEFPLYVKDKVKISQNCLKDNCLALKISKISNPKEHGHPAAGYCEELKGQYQIVRHPAGDEDGICLFKDSSFILAWDLYYLHHPKKESP